MLISEFARASGLPVDTVRFYIRKGLLHPESTSMGGSRPYHQFNARHLQTAERIRIGREMGFTLQQIGGFIAEFRSGRLTPRQSARNLRGHRRVLQARIERMNKLLLFLDAKVAWLEEGGAEPRLDSFLSEN